jgi:hypothetical protein
MNITYFFIDIVICLFISAILTIKAGDRHPTNSYFLSEIPIFFEVKIF